MAWRQRIELDLFTQRKAHTWRFRFDTHTHSQNWSVRVCTGRRVATRHDAQASERHEHRKHHPSLLSAATTTNSHPVLCKNPRGYSERANERERVGHTLTHSVFVCSSLRLLLLLLLRLLLVQSRHTLEVYEIHTGLCNCDPPSHTFVASVKRRWECINFAHKNISSTGGESAKVACRSIE